MIRSSFFKHKAIHTPISFSSLNMVHEVPLRQKEAYAPPQASKRAKHLQWQKGLWPQAKRTWFSSTNWAWYKHLSTKLAKTSIYSWERQFYLFHKQNAISSWIYGKTIKSIAFTSPITTHAQISHIAHQWSMYIREAFPSTGDPKMAILPGFVQKVKCMKGMQQNEHMTHIYMRSSKTQLERKAHPASEWKWLGQAVWWKWQLADLG